MWVIKTLENYIETKQYLSDMILLVKKRRNTMPKKQAELLNVGFVEQIKQFVKQLRKYRREKRNNK